MTEIKLNEQNFDQEILKSDMPAMVDFWAEWCGPCKLLNPIIAEIAGEFEGKIKVGKVNVDENNALAGRYGIMSIPTIKFFKGGKLVGELIGAAPKQSIVEEIKKHL